MLAGIVAVLLCLNPEAESLPPVSADDLWVFPCAAASESWHAARARLDWLEDHRGLEAWRSAELEEAIRRQRLSLECWRLLCSAGRPPTYGAAATDGGLYPWQLDDLRSLRDLIGPAAYYRGAMPPAVVPYSVY